MRKEIIPGEYFYLRNHFPYPSLTPHSYLLPIEGTVKRPLVTNIQELVKMPSKRFPRTDLEGIFPYARSLPVEKALHPDTLIAYAYNDRPIPFKHGYPLRLIVPQWYGMASVK